MMADATDDVRNLADMLDRFFGPMSEEGIPRDRVEGLARELATHYGDYSFDTQAAIDEWLGPYLD